MELLLLAILAVWFLAEPFTASGAIVLLVLAVLAKSLEKK